MAFQPVPNTAQFDMIFTQHGEIVENVYHIHREAGWTSGQLIIIADLLMAWWKANLRPIVHTDVVLDRVEARDISVDGGVAIVRDCTVDCSGQVLGAEEPNNVTVAVKLATGQSGRSFRGRKFHLGIPAAEVLGNQLSTSHQNALQAGYFALIATMTAQGVTWVVVSRFHNLVQRPVGLTTPIIAVSVDPNLDSMRRRLAGRGQ